MVRALDRKLLRELWRLRGQIASIALVVACGVMSVVIMRGTYESLRNSLELYYSEYAFADVFASLERAPESLAARIADLPGVAAVETRIAQIVNLDVPGLGEPAVAQLLSIPPEPRWTLNRIHIVRGRYIDAARADEALVSESFAQANGLRPGDTLRAVINGRSIRLRLVGIAISPDYIGEIAPGAVFPDDRRFAILRMNRDALGPALGMAGAFSDVSLQLVPGASEAAAIEALDGLLEPYGGRGAYGRDRHVSHEAVMAELDQNRVFGTAIPAIFLGVAVFLLSIVLGRLVAVQREEIGVLKAFGYGNLQIGRHYLLFALVAVLIGAAFGLLLGLWLGRGLTTLYAEYFRFPRLVYETSWGMIAAAVVLSVFAGAVGAAQGVRSAAKLPPAEALRPSAPARFRPGPLERAGVGGRLSPASLMILRNLERRPLRAIASMTGVAFGVAVLVFGFFFLDAIDYMLDLQFRRIQREDLAVYFNTARPASIGHDLSRMSGVMRAETFRSVPVRLSNGHRSRTTALVGVASDATIRRLVDQAARLRTVPATGVMLNATLARALDVRPGDAVRAEVLEGERRVRWVRVTATIDELVGTTAYMDDRELHTLLGQARAASGAYLRVELSSLDSVNSQLKRLPALAGVYSPAAVRASFEQQLSENLLISITFLVSLASVLAIGVVYNGARIALSERGRELASLRVLGFTRKEVEVLLLGEQGLLTALAIPFGWVIGFAMSAWTLSAFASERYRIPFVITTRTYFWSAAVTLLAATIAGLALRRRLNRLDLVAVLKTRE